MPIAGDLDHMREIDAVTAHLRAPLAVVDLPALGRNADDLVRRARGMPIRIATKSVRCRAVLEWALARPGFLGLMAYSLREAIWLVRMGATDVLVAYPTTDLDALAELAQDDQLREAITVMIDDVAHLHLIDACRTGPIRVCIDIDASLRLGPLHLGVRRSPLHEVHEVIAVLRQAMSSSIAHVVGLMCYDAQVAGVPDSSLVVRLMKRRSLVDLAARRAAIVSAVRSEVDLEFVNAGGTGSLGLVSQQSEVTEVSAGSGLFGPTLFDHYEDFTPEPALVYALPVVRAPAPRIRTVFAGGYLASGPVGPSRAPTPIWPPGLRLLRTEGAGEVQTPVSGAAATRLSIGDRVWWRHAKAGEICEHFTELVLIDAEPRSIEPVPTYRGEGQCFG